MRTSGETCNQPFFLPINNDDANWGIDVWCTSETQCEVGSTNHVTGIIMRYTNACCHQITSLAPDDTLKWKDRWLLHKLEKVVQQHLWIYPFKSLSSHVFKRLASNLTYKKPVVSGSFHFPLILLLRLSVVPDLTGLYSHPLLWKEKHRHVLPFYFLKWVKGSLWDNRKLTDCLTECECSIWQAVRN